MSFICIIQPFNHQYIYNNNKIYKQNSGTRSLKNVQAHTSFTMFCHFGFTSHCDFCFIHTSPCSHSFTHMTQRERERRGVTQRETETDRQKQWKAPIVAFQSLLKVPLKYLVGPAPSSGSPLQQKGNAVLLYVL